MADTPEKISPLRDLARARVAEGSIGVDLSERLPASLVQIQAWPQTIKKAEAALKKAAGKNAIVMNTGPGRWLVESDEVGLEEVLRTALPIDVAAVTGLTHARVVISVDGSKAEWVLASGIALDFSLKAFPVGSTQLSHHHEIGITLHRTGQQSFDLYVFTSLARGFWHWIEHAGMEVGLSVG